MVWKDQVNVLDQGRIFKLLARGPRLEGYLTQLRKATKLDFASWGGFAQNFSQRRIPFENPESTAIWNAAPSELLFIPTFAADFRGAYLPASALKGALRTGLVFSRWSAATIDRVSSALEGDRVPRRLAEAAENAAGASQVKVFSAADSQPVPVSSFKVYLTRVASLETRQQSQPQLAWKVAGRGSVPPQRIADSTPLFAEMAVPGTVFQRRLRRAEILRKSRTDPRSWLAVQPGSPNFGGQYEPVRPRSTRTARPLCRDHRPPRATADRCPAPGRARFCCRIAPRLPALPGVGERLHLKSRLSRY